MILDSCGKVIHGSSVFQVVKEAMQRATMQMMQEDLEAFHKIVPSRLYDHRGRRIESGVEFVISEREFRLPIRQVTVQPGLFGMFLV